MNILGGNYLQVVLDETIGWVLIQIGIITVHLYKPDEAKGGKRGIPYSVEVAKEPDEDASGESAR